MATQLITLAVFPRGKPIAKLPEELSVPRGAPTYEIYQQLSALSGASVHRLRVAKGSDGQAIPNSRDVAIRDTGLLDGSKITVKDLGPQMGWQTVYLVEYLGPLVIHPLFYLLRPYIYHPRNPSSVPAPSWLQTMAVVVITTHFAKRELETLFLHRFSRATMPLFNLYKNCLYYWGVSGFIVAYFIYGPTAPTASPSIAWLTWLGLTLYGVGELGTLYAHLVLRSLRSPGGSERGIPRGIGFDWVTSPNYMYELWAWTGILLLTRSWSVVLFMTIATIQMAIWGQQRERAYRREFGDKYKAKRYILMPGLY